MIAFLGEYNALAGLSQEANLVEPSAVEYGANGHGSGHNLLGSTDVGDVSWVVPTVQLWRANYAIGTPFHSWQKPPRPSKA